MKSHRIRNVIIVALLIASPLITLINPSPLDISPNDPSGTLPVKSVNTVDSATVREDGSTSVRSGHVQHFETGLNNAISYIDFDPESLFDTSYDEIFHSPPDDLRAGAFELDKMFNDYGSTFGYSYWYTRCYMNYTTPPWEGQAKCTGATLTLTTSNETLDPMDLGVGLAKTYWDENMFKIGYDIDEGDLPAVYTSFLSDTLQVSDADETVSFDVTQHVDLWFNGQTNYGLVLKTPEAYTNPSSPNRFGVTLFHNQNGPSGKVPKLTVDYIQNHAPDAFITSDPELIVKEGKSITLEGSGSDPDGDGIDGYLWESDLDGILGTDAKVTLNNLSMGTHKITFKVRDDVDGFPLWSREKWRMVDVKPNYPDVETVTASKGGVGGISFKQGSTIDISVVVDGGWSPLQGWINISDIDGVVQYASKEPMTSKGSFELAYQWDSTGAPRGLYRVDVVVWGSQGLYDHDGLFGPAPDLVFNLVDSEPPVISEIDAMVKNEIKEIFEMGDFITIQAKEGSYETGLLVTLNITDPDGSPLLSNRKMGPTQEDGTYQFVWNTMGLSREGQYTLKVTMQDDSLNRASQEIALNLVDSFQPEVAAVEVMMGNIQSKSFPLNSLLTIAVSELSSEEGLEGDVTIVNGDDETVVDGEPLVAAGNGLYYYIWDTEGYKPGMYGINVTLADQQGNIDLNGLGIVDQPDVWLELEVPDDEALALKILDTHPSSGDLDIPLSSTVEILFSREVDPETITDDNIPVLEDTNIIPGNWEVDGTNRFCRFVPDESWEEDTLYKVMITEDVTSPEGWPIEETEFTFRTETIPPETFIPPQSRILVNTTENQTFQVNPEQLDFFDKDQKDQLTFQWSLNGARIKEEDDKEYSFFPQPGDEGRHELTVLAMGPNDDQMEKTWIITVMEGDENSGGTDTDDTDGDGLPDLWEKTHFGDLTETGTGDHDGDGVSNAEELEAGTSPSSSESEEGNGSRALTYGLLVACSIMAILVVFTVLKHTGMIKDRSLGGTKGGGAK